METQTHKTIEFDAVSVQVATPMYVALVYYTVMSLQYESILNSAVEEAVSEIERESHLYWDEVVDEVVEEFVYSQMTSGDHIDFLEYAKPHDEWQVYCSDMTEPTLVYEAMCRVALRIKLIEKLENEHADLVD